MTKLKEKEKKKYQGGPKRRGYLNKIAASGRGDGRGEYSKYGDLSPSDVHTGSATYGGQTYQDDPSTTQRLYSRAVRRGYSKIYYRFQNKLWKITNNAGTESEEMQV